jgi:hypothetical protein
MTLPPGLKRFVFKQATLDDLEKLHLASHKPDDPAEASGGGARDVRFRPWKNFEPVFRRMFEPANKGDRVRFSGRLYVPGTHEWDEVLVWSPTGARGDEGWVAQSYKLRAFNTNVPASPDPPVFFLFAQDGDGKVWGGYLKYEDLQVHPPKWHTSVSEPVLQAVAAARKGATVRGFVDLELGQEEFFA